MSQRPSPSTLLVFTLVVFASVGAAGAPAAIETGPTETVATANTTNYAYPADGAPSREAYAQADVDVAAAVSASVDSLHGTHDERTFTRRYDDAGTETDRLAVVRDTVDDLQTRLDRLDTRQASLYRSYANGSVSRETFLRRLAQLDVRAEEVQALIDRVEARVDEDPTTALPDRLGTQVSAQRASLLLLPSDLTTRVRTALTSTGTPLTVYADGTEDSLILATVEDDEFVRQTTLRSEYAPDQPNQFADGETGPLSQALNRFRDLYPWAFENQDESINIGGFRGAAVYDAELSHRHGTLHSYIHGGTTNVFHEIHRQQPSDLPVRLRASATNDTIAVSVNATVETGPMLVRTTSTSSGTPTNATIFVDGQRVGTTGSDGQLWTVRPSGTFTVNVTTADGSVELTR